ncbi:MAG: Rieske (2Fe-2S) protein [Alphaproteobacteria bacterium]|nr:Rieske (2Fe-2S) protein [Alphaproteobacteria bacterium]
MSRVLCRLTDIPDGEGKEFDLERGGEDDEIFVVRRGDRIFGYVNSCPHVGTPLNWVEDRFMTSDKTLIMCATHGACFRIADGHCVAGPCVGESLRSISTVVRDGEAMLDKDKGRGDQS